MFQTAVQYAAVTIKRLTFSDIRITVAAVR